MARNERITCKELIEPRLAALGWAWQEQLRIGPGRVNLTGDAMYDATQSIIADYLLRYRGVPLAILEAKSEAESAADGMQQASRYARRLSLRFSIASNGNDWILTDNDTGDFESLSAPPSPDELVARTGVSVDWSRWEGAFAAGYHMDQVSRKTALDHYRLFGIDDLEQARTYGAPQFAEQFGSFTTLTQRYGGPALLKADLELVKQHLYVPMAA